MWRLRIQLFVLFPAIFSTCLALLPGQATKPAPRPNQDPQAEAVAKQEAEAKARAATLAKLLKDIADREQDLVKAKAKVTAAADAAARLAAQEPVKELETELKKMRGDFQTLATGVELAEFESPARAGAKLLEEIETVLRPLVQELKDASQGMRQNARQRTEIEDFAQRRRIAERALEGLRGLKALDTSNIDASVQAQVDDLEQQWARRLTDARNRETIAKHQLETRLASRAPLLESSRDAVARFFQTRGLHILTALGAFLLVFLGLRFLARPFRRFARRQGKAGEGPGMYLRVFSVTFHLFVLVLAVIAALTALYVADDWGLLGLALLILFGLLWTSKEALPRFFQQIRLLLNLGAVRQGERLILHGVPWRVGRINIFTRLSNPELAASLRIPIQELLGSRSRPLAPNETWFPCQVGDWVILSDGNRGKVIEQSVDLVRIVELGGARFTYQTSTFLGLNPRNISADFRATVTFGVDYAHQAICTTEIPQAMQSRLRSDLFEMLGENLANVSVQFAAAGPSSLDFAALVDVRGEAAARFSEIHRAIQRSLVDSCNAHGWVIPFTQITVHQAAG